MTIEQATTARRTRRTLIVATLVGLGWLVLAVVRADSEASLAPRNFSWVDVAGLNASFLLPDGWHYTNNKGKLLTSFAIAEQAPAIGRRFETGLTVFVIKNMGRVSGATLGSQLQRFVQLTVAAAEHSEATTAEIQHGHLHGTSVQFRRAGNPVSVVHRRYLADTRADRLLIITFESPAASWQSAWRIGETLVSQFRLRQ